MASTAERQSEGALACGKQKAGPVEARGDHSGPVWTAPRCRVAIRRRGAGRIATSQETGQEAN